MTAITVRVVCGVDGVIGAAVVAPSEDDVSATEPTADAAVSVVNGAKAGDNDAQSLRISIAW